MSEEEIKLQCVRFAADILGTYSNFYNSTAPSVEEVMKEAEKIYTWVSKK